MTLVLNACTSSRQAGGLISTNLSINSYASARERASYSKEASYYFPLLEIYNESGILVYQSHESLANTQVLKGFPESVRNLPPQEQAPRLKKILAEFPAFKAREQEIATRKKWVIISTGLDGCEGCAVQERALNEAKQRILMQQPADILVIHVSPP